MMKLDQTDLLKLTTIPITINIMITPSTMMIKTDLFRLMAMLVTITNVMITIIVDGYAWSPLLRYHTGTDHESLSSQSPDLLRLITMLITITKIVITTITMMIKTDLLRLNDGHAGHHYQDNDHNLHHDDQD